MSSRSRSVPKLRGPDRTAETRKCVCPKCGRCLFEVVKCCVVYVDRTRRNRRRINVTQKDTRFRCVYCTTGCWKW